VIDLDGGELEKLAKNISEGKRPREERVLIWLETPKNPSCALQDIARFCQLAKVIGARVAVDSTFATPILQKPLSLGADFVVHSSSKFLGGHSDLIAGTIVTRTADEQKALQEARSVDGDCLGNLEAWLLLRSLRTLELRVLAQSQSAASLAEWLEKQIALGRGITKVYYPSLKSNRDYELCVRQMGGHGGGMLAVETRSADHSIRLQKSLKLFKDATSLGGYESLIDYRYRWDKTVPQSLLRISVGLESAKDLIADFDQALRQLETRPRL